MAPFLPKHWILSILQLTAGPQQTKTLKELNGGNEINVYSHSVSNESWIEHSFGFQQKKGQGNLQNMVEYIQSKRHQTTPTL